MLTDELGLSAIVWDMNEFAALNISVHIELCASDNTKAEQIRNANALNQHHKEHWHVVNQHLLRTTQILVL